MKDLAAEYVRGEPGVLALFAHPPRTLLQHHPNDKYPVFITGQQPGLLTGPLYTIHKAATVVKLAQLFRDRFWVEPRALFWVGSEDHDFEETRSTWILTRDHQPLELTYTPEADVRGMPMHRVPAEASLHDIIGRAADAAVSSELGPGIASFLHESLDAAASFSDWTTRILAKLFEGTGLEIVCPHDPELRRRAAPVLEQEIREPLQTTAQVIRAAEHVARMGYTPQVVKSPEECAFFLESGGRRRKVVHEGGRFKLPETREAYGQDDLLALLRDAPERFSPNVALRPVVQQLLFNPAAYIAGPGEIAYWAQLREVFERFGQPMPVVYPRARAVVTSMKVRKLLTLNDLSVEDMTEPRDTLIERALAHRADTEARRVFDERSGAITSAIEHLRRGFDGLDPTAAEMAGALGRHAAAQLERIRRNLDQADTGQASAVQTQVDRLRNTLAPHRKPQERFYSVFSFAFTHGWPLAGRITDALDVESFALNEVVI